MSQYKTTAQWAQNPQKMVFPRISTARHRRSTLPLSSFGGTRRREGARRLASEGAWTWRGRASPAGGGSALRRLAGARSALPLLPYANHRCGHQGCYRQATPSPVPPSPSTVTSVNATSRMVARAPDHAAQPRSMCGEGTVEQCVEMEHMTRFSLFLGVFSGVFFFFWGFFVFVLFFYVFLIYLYNFVYLAFFGFFNIYVYKVSIRSNTKFVHVYVYIYTHILYIQMCIVLMGLDGADWPCGCSPARTRSATPSPPPPPPSLAVTEHHCFPLLSPPPSIVASPCHHRRHASPTTFPCHRPAAQAPLRPLALTPPSTTAFPPKPACAQPYRCLRDHRICRPLPFHRRI